MAGLHVRVVDQAGRIVQERWFSHFPVRVGRNPLNDLVLAEPFVSQFHAILEMHGGRAHLRDLGSKNGIQMDSIRMPAHENVPLMGEKVSFWISSLRFDLRWEDEGFPEEERSSGVLFIPKGSQPPGRVPEITKSMLLSDLGLRASRVPSLVPDLGEDSLSETTLVRQTPDVADTSVDEPSEVTVVKEGARSAEEPVGPVPMPTINLDPLGVEQDIGKVPGVSRQMVESLRPLVSLRTTMRSTMARLHVTLAEDAEALTPSQRDELFEWLVKKLPWIAGEPDFHRVAELYGVDVSSLGTGAQDAPVERVALEGLRWLGSTLVPHAPRIETEEQVVGFVSKIHDTLSVFVRSFIPLRDGYRAFTTGMDIIRASRSDGGSEQIAVDAVEKGRTLEEVAGALLDYGTRGEGPQRAVEGAFADLMIHQIALLQGVMRGVKSLLGELAPDKIEAALEKQRSRGGVGLTLGPYRYKELWNLFRRKHGDIDDGESVAFGYVFGPEFARAYQRLIDDAEGQGPAGGSDT